MAEQQQQQPPDSVRSTPPPRAATPAAGKWTPADLSLRMAEQHVSMAVLQAAMEDAGKVTLDSPDQAKALVDAFLRKPIARTYPPGKPDDAAKGGAR